MSLHIEVVETMDYASPVNVTVGTATAELAATNNNRKYLRVTNLSNAAIYLGFGEDAVLNKGVYVAASGGIFEMNINNLTNEAVNAISSASSKSVAVQEAS